MHESILFSHSSNPPRAAAILFCRGLISTYMYYLLTHIFAIFFFVVVQLRHGIDRNSWIKMNAGQSGFYRVNYERDNWDKLISQLERDHKVTGIFSSCYHCLCYYT